MNRIIERITTLIFRSIFAITIMGVLVFIMDFGYEQGSVLQRQINIFYYLVISLGVISTLLRYLIRRKTIRKKVLWVDIISFIIIGVVMYFHYYQVTEQIFTSWFDEDITVKIIIFLTFIREFSEIRFEFKRTLLNPAQLFILSFLTIIFIGSLLLMLPNASNGELSYVDALFTSTSAVCVTGLIVVDTGSFFTSFGQAIILILIQVGGLGILTFASYFSYFFKGGSTFENQLLLSDMTNAQKINEVFTLMRRVITTTFIIELAGAVLIFYSLDNTLIGDFKDQVFFSFFHSVSAFCNAGFSTLTNSLYESGFNVQYDMHLVVIFLFVIGGLGFPIVFNLLRYVNFLLRNRLFNFSGKRSRHLPWILNLDSKITLVTTLTLTVVGTVIFLWIEWDNTLTEHSGIGKFITALFGAATPRTAGFNSVDMNALAFPTVMLTFLLMWIGASPGSTGGGIKTSTFAIATLNFISLARGMDRIEVFKREISGISVRRAFATISLSLMVIGTAILLITLFDPDLGLKEIAFECFSAYSTVGLSLGVTGILSTWSKVVIMAVMFIGRVSMLSILIAIFRKIARKNYHYPKEEILIN